jgi:hypothetical protein
LLCWLLYLGRCFDFGHIVGKAVVPHLLVLEAVRHEPLRGAHEARAEDLRGVVHEPPHQLLLRARRHLQFRQPPYVSMYVEPITTTRRVDTTRPAQTHLASRGEGQV